MNGGGLFDKFAFGGMAKGNKVRALALSAAGRSAKRRKPESGTTAVKASTSAASQPGGGDGRTKPAGGLLPKLGSRPLRLILVGHNPSAHAWSSGHYYSHPGNRMWPILRETGIAPADLVRGCEDDGSMPESCGVGFIDVGVGHPGTDSSKIDLRDEKFHGGFYAHLRDHLELAGAPPRIVAFTGKKQFVDLLNANRRGKKVQTVALGPQDPASLPRGWPFPPTTRVFVLTSTSGASALTNEARIRPYAELAKELSAIDWPLPPPEPPSV